MKSTQLIKNIKSISGIVSYFCPVKNEYVTERVTPEWKQDPSKIKIKLIFVNHESRNI